METTFNDIDALVLSVIYKHNQIDLVKWIGMIDFYERIILTFDELNTSLEKLQKCGLIKFLNGVFILLMKQKNYFLKVLTFATTKKYIINLKRKNA